MRLEGLLGWLDSLPAFQTLGRSVATSDSPLSISRVSAPEASRPYLVGALLRYAHSPVLVVTARRDRARSFVEQLRTWWTGRGTYLFPDPEALPYERSAWGRAVAERRLEALIATRSNIDDGQAGAPPVLIATARGLARLTLPASVFEDEAFRLEVGEVAPAAATRRRLVSIGYEPATMVTAPGEYSQRGGILDVMPPGAEAPIRIEYSGEELFSLRAFDRGTQRSIGPVEAIWIPPAREALPGHAALADALREADLSGLLAEAAEEIGEDLAALARGQAVPAAEFYLPLLYPATGTLADYLPDEALVVWDDPEAVAQTWEVQRREAEGLREDLLRRGELPTWVPPPLMDTKDLVRRLGRHRRLELLPPGTEGRGLDSAFGRPPAYGGRLDEMIADALDWSQNGVAAALVSRQASRLSELFSEWGVSLVPQEMISEPPRAGNLVLVQGGLEQGFRVEAPTPAVVLTDGEAFGWSRRERRRLPRPRPTASEAFFADVSPGDHVVHVEHGIGRYRGLVTLVEQGVAREYLHVAFAEGDALYVPTFQADRLSRYVGTGERPPRIDRLGAPDWDRVVARAKRAVEEIARDLLDLYASRETVRGFAFSADSAWQADLESSFPYVETPDQGRVLEQIKADMEQPRPMDRLVAGDVGYGKTEVALRAGFKAVMDGKQVAMLVPTTVLAQQHYRTFTRRLRPFPVEVDVLSRFRTAREQEEVLARVAAGTVDIVIGTHRLLQADVVFADLGLLVIDEEQRFGVAQKERLKAMRSEVDVLTLTATPIPRTLHLSLTGVRDLSTIETPPEARQAVATQVLPYDEPVIRRALLRELDRGGQAYFVHSRVRGIEAVAARLRRLMPEAEVAVAHGQMPRSALADTMMAFEDGEHDVLVCTSIVENGIDIPNVNTLIVNRADRFGLAQLYQLRGRVGRSAAPASAYFLYDEGRLTDAARERLRTIQEAAELGSGFRIALRDLEIRGAGEILGAKQHGHIAAVGFDLYTRLLAQAVRNLREGKPLDLTALAPPHPAGPSIDLPLEAALPSVYVSQPSLRLGLYRRLASLTELSHVEEVAEELADRFGPLPAPTRHLMYLLGLKIRGALGGVDAISARDGSIVIQIRDGRRLRGRVLPEGARGRGDRIWLPMGEGWRARIEKVLEWLSAD
ncbi:MAG: transcription-repair coupling factor [Anaerolineae bacterium]